MEGRGSLAGAGWLLTRGAAVALLRRQARVLVAAVEKPSQLLLLGRSRRRGCGGRQRRRAVDAGLCRASSAWHLELV